MLHTIILYTVENKFNGKNFTTKNLRNLREQIIDKGILEVVGGNGIYTTKKTYRAYITDPSNEITYHLYEEGKAKPAYLK